ncbi:MAG: T9SS type B sorting domain-containing protein [Moheibacter sp.]
MKRIAFILFLFFSFTEAQTITDPQDYYACDEDGDGYVTIPFSELQNYALDYLEEFNESPEIYVTKAYNGIAKITNLYNNPQVIHVCDSDGNGGYYDIAINNQQEIFIARQGGFIQKINPQTCTITNIGQAHPNGQSVLALSFDKLNHLYEGGWTSQVFRADAQNLSEFHLWHDFIDGRAAGDFVQIGEFLYVAWTVDGTDYLYKVTLGTNNQYVSHENLGPIDNGTYGLAVEYGRLYGNTPNYLYEINLETMETMLIRQRPNQSNTAGEWWGAAGLHEALDMQITYHEELNEALTGTNPLADPYTNPFPFTGQIFIRIHEATNDVTYIIPINLIIEVAPAAADAELEECRDEDLGMATFQLNNAQMDINPGAGLNFTYFESLENLTAHQNPLPLSYSVPQTTTVFVKVSDGSPDCYGVAELELLVPTAENVDYDSEVVFCQGTEAVLSVPDEFTNYQWNGLTGEDSDQPLDQHEVIVSLPGNYSVTVTDVSGCSYTLPFQVSSGGEPEITGVSVDGKSLTVLVSPAGQYEYSLNGVFWQNSNTFYPIEPDDYEIYVRDFSGCSSDKYEFTYFYIPNFISPNNDGYNDVWEIRGLNEYPDAAVRIFDRYGKLFFDRKINSNSFVWDGKYLGRTVPSGTYWYILTLSEEKRITGSVFVRN